MKPKADRFKSYRQGDFHSDSHSREGIRCVLTKPGRKTGLRGEATPAPVQVPEWRAASSLSRPTNASSSWAKPFWPQCDKSRERDGSALASNKPPSFLTWTTSIRPGSATRSRPSPRPAGWRESCWPVRCGSQRTMLFRMATQNRTFLLCLDISNI